MPSLFKSKKVEFSTDLPKTNFTQYDQYTSPVQTIKEGKKFYKTTLKDGKFKAKIRFLPAHPDCEDLAYIKIHQHNFEVSTGSFNEKSGKMGKRYFNDICNRLTFNKPCPICEYGYEKVDPTTPRWKTYSPEQRKMFPNTKYISNILVINDEQNPDNNGQVFLFEYGNGISKLIETAVRGVVSKDEEENQPPKDIFDHKEGYNFILEYEMEKGNPYPKLTGKFANKSTPIQNEEKVISEMIPLSQLVIKEEDCNSVEKVKERFDFVLFGNQKKSEPVSKQPIPKVTNEDTDLEDDLDTSFKKPIEKKKSSVIVDDDFGPVKSKVDKAISVINEDDDMAFLNNIDED